MIPLHHAWCSDHGHCKHPRRRRFLEHEALAAVLISPDTPPLPEANPAYSVRRRLA